VLQPAVRSLGLALRPPEPVERAAGGAWFVRDLFTDVVFPDATLATASLGARGRLRRAELVQVGAWGLAFLVLASLFVGLSCSNGAVVGRARRAAVEVANRVTDETALVDNLRTLDRLREAADDLDRVHRRVSLGRRLGGWSGGVARDPAVRLYMQRMTRFVLEPSVRRLEEDLRGRVGGAPGRFLDDFYRFRAWRLLTQPPQIDAEDAPVLTREVIRTLEDRLALGGTDAAGRSEYPELIRRQMTFIARNPADLAAVIREEVAEPDRALIAPMAAIVHDTWDSRAFYDELLGDLTARLKPLGFADLAGSTPLMQGAVAVPGPFTRDGCNQHVRPAAAWHGRLVRRDALLNETFDGRAPDLERDLLTFYAEDATRHWVAFLDGIEYTPQRTIGGVEDQLARLAKGDSPIFRLLRGARDQVQGMVVPGTPLEALAHNFRLLSEFFASPGTLGQRAKDFLGEIARRLPGQGGSPSTLRESIDAQYMRYLGKAQGDVKGLGPGAPLDRLQALLSPPPDQTNGVFELVNFADGLGRSYSDTPSGAVVGRLLRAPVDAARRVVTERGLGPRVAQAWEGMFLQRFNQDLAGRYPFSAGGADASPEAFAACFGPQGYFWAFYTQHLAPFLNEDGSSKSGEAPPVNAAMVDFLRKAHVIRQAFFAAGPQPELAFAASTTPPEHGAGVLVRWVAFDCGGATMTYTMGPPRDETVRWPGADALAGAGIRAQAAPPEDPKRRRRKNDPTTIAVEPVSAPGYWGLFRLLDRASAISGGGGVTRVTWRLSAANGTSISSTWDLKVSSGESPFARGFMRLTPPATP
jgi:type VI secretion system protein ImpL